MLAQKKCGVGVSRLAKFTINNNVLLRFRWSSRGPSKICPDRYSGFDLAGSHHRSGVPMHARFAFTVGRNKHVIWQRPAGAVRAYFIGYHAIFCKITFTVMRVT